MTPPLHDPMIPLPQSPPDPEPDESSEPSYTSRRNGTVARLPKVVRDQISEMLLDGLTYAQIIDKIGEPGKHLVEDHIRSWKKGGYQDWLLDLDRKEALRATREAALDLVNEKAGTTVQHASRAIAAAQLYELLLSFNPATFATALASKPELYFRLINCLSRLSEGEAICGQRRAQEALLDSKLNPVKPANGSNSVAPETLKEIARLIKLL